MGFKLRDLTKIPVDGETCMAEELARIEEELKHVDDPGVWYRDDGGPDGEPDGMFWELRWRASIDPTLHTAAAVGIAFELGKASIAGTVDSAVVSKWRAYKDAWRRGAQNGTTTRQANAAEWRAMLPQLIEKHRAVGRGHQDWKSRGDLAAMAKEDIKKGLGRTPKESTIADAIEEIERESSQQAKALRQRNAHANR
jgi:hypothetical protein